MFATLAKRLLAVTPYRIARGRPNRFQAIESCLEHLRDLGFAPRLIVDAGAHVGAFSLEANRIFPQARIHMIEPQPACHGALKTLSEERGFVFHPVALSNSPGTVRMICGTKLDTGAHIAWEQNRDLANTDVEAATLDGLFAADMTAADRTLLKLDLQGHELLALQGASTVLPLVEVALVEVSFFQQIGEPSIADVVGFFDANGFDLFDVAALAGRFRDDRLRQGDLIFVRHGSPLLADRRWE
ncbi:methyltransferase, FkbM family [Enhydrobacter aerosaccus]|uniref:Methyltransferase, FkbM family n=2 Tax=Enhydrobacter aerosaccus TaxID=225324 RepID=A0A1T4TEF2_9HYPH|nr:methyltransferase, FkbM family [Enhydrobacter aerosaccus]